MKEKSIIQCLYTIFKVLTNHRHSLFLVIQRKHGTSIITPKGNQIPTISKQLNQSESFVFIMKLVIQIIKSENINYRHDLKKLLSCPSIYLSMFLSSKFQKPASSKHMCQVQKFIQRCFGALIIPWSSSLNHSRPELPDVLNTYKIHWTFV